MAHIQKQEVAPMVYVNGTFMTMEQFRVMVGLMMMTERR